MSVLTTRLYLLYSFSIVNALGNYMKLLYRKKALQKGHTRSISTSKGHRTDII
jgi:hypothetical protein